MIELIRKLTDVNGVSGNEEAAAALIADEMKPYVDEIRTDTLGNLICVKKGKGKRIMLAAHMDEIGIIVTHIDDKGFLRFTGLGGINHFYSLYQKVAFTNGTIGVIGHEEEPGELKDLMLDKMYIDIGAGSREEAVKKVKVGDAAAFIGSFAVNGDMVVSKALDDRSGCAVLIETARQVGDCENEIYFVFTTQEELGLRGAKPAAYAVEPEMAIVVDVSGAGDTPKAKTLPVKCGDGPAIKVMDKSAVSHPEVKQLLVETAKKIGIPYQFKVAAAGGTDAGVISVSRGGVPTAMLAIPCRYIHSPAEMVNINDMANAAKLLAEAVKNA